MIYIMLIINLLLLVSLTFCIFYIINRRNLYRNNIDYRNNEKDNLIKEKNLLQSINMILKKQLKRYEEEENIYNTPNGVIKKLDTFKGKTALIGDYSSTSYCNTRSVLLSLGFDIDIITNVSDIERLIKSGKKYDVIFSNNIYHNGTGKELLHKLKKIDTFNVPIVLHSATSNLENYSIENGFSGFLHKPIKQEETIILLNKLLENKIYQ